MNISPDYGAEVRKDLLICGNQTLLGRIPEEGALARKSSAMGPTPGDLLEVGLVGLV